MRNLIRRCAKAILVFQGCALLIFGAFGFCNVPGVVAFWTQLGGLWLLGSIAPRWFESTMARPPHFGCHEEFTLVGTLALFLANSALLLAVVSTTVIVLRVVSAVTRSVLRELAGLGGIVLRPLVRGAFRHGLLASQRELPP